MNSWLVLGMLVLWMLGVFLTVLSPWLGELAAVNHRKGSDE